MGGCITIYLLMLLFRVYELQMMGCMRSLGSKDGKGRGKMCNSVLLHPTWNLKEPVFNGWKWWKTHLFNAVIWNHPIETTIFKVDVLGFRYELKAFHGLNFQKTSKQLATLKSARIHCMGVGQILVIIQHHLDHINRSNHHRPLPSLCLKHWRYPSASFWLVKGDTTTQH